VEKEKEKGSRAKKKPTKRTRAIIHNKMCRDLRGMEEPFKRRAYSRKGGGFRSATATAFYFSTKLLRVVFTDLLTNK
jgi:hypothetical protein